jgi:ABC-type cobalamin/Fe3+-siderophores transport system ATPase subunit
MTLLSRLGRQGWWGQIVGPHGSGKSTLLAALLPELHRRRTVVLVELHEHQRQLPATVWRLLVGPTLLVVDGCEQLAWWTRWRLLARCRRQGVGLLVTAHRDVGLPDLYRTQVKPELARDIVADLLTDEQQARMASVDLGYELARHQGNLRETLFALYDHYERICLPEEATEPEAMGAKQRVP